MGASSLKFYDLTVGAFPINSRHTKLQFALWDLLNKSEKILENYPESGMEGEISAAEVSNVNCWARTSWDQTREVFNSGL